MVEPYKPPADPKAALDAAFAAAMAHPHPTVAMVDELIALVRAVYGVDDLAAFDLVQEAVDAGV